MLTTDKYGINTAKNYTNYLIKIENKIQITKLVQWINFEKII